MKAALAARNQTVLKSSLLRAQEGYAMRLFWYITFD